MTVRAALAVGLALVVLAAALVMSGSPPRVVGTSDAAMQARVASLHGGTGACQTGETLPRGTSVVRFGLEAVIGPSVTVTVRSEGRVLARGSRGAGWTGADVAVPVGRTGRAIPDATVCLTLGKSREIVTLIGQLGQTPPATSSSGEPGLGRMRIEYLAPGRRSWWSLALSVARRIGTGRAPSGTWVVLLPVLLMVAVAILASGLSIGKLGASKPRPDPVRGEPTGRLAGAARFLRRVPTAAWVCALVACLNAASWSILSPPFQVPDEPSHFAYVQQLADAHRLPVGGTDEFSPQENAILDDLDYHFIKFLPRARTISSRAQEQTLEADLAHPLPGTGPGDAGTASTEPPLYYALETVPYELGASGSLLDRLQLMRLLSAVFGGLTALFAFMFVRETLPRVPWAWTAGGLGVALAPLLGFMSGAVNPEAMLSTVSAALFYLLARGFRRGLTCKLAAAIGALIAIGLLTKLNFLGLLPGAIVGLIVLALRTRAKSRRTAHIALAVGLGVAASPALLYIAFESLVGRASLNLVSNSSSDVLKLGALPSEISYVWQFYLPRLPGMTDYFPGISTSRVLWFDGFVGLYGWADTPFAGWVYDLALLPAGILAVLAVRALAIGRVALRRRAMELFVYAAMGVGAMALVGAASYTNDVVNQLGPYTEPRYLLPLLPLLAVVLALAARGAGRRFGPAVGVLIVVLILGHNVFSQLLVVSRYYG